MPPEVSDGATLDNPGPAFGSGSRSRRFVNLSSIFHSKRVPSTTSHHRRGASLDSATTCLGGGAFHWQYKFRDALFCEQPGSGRASLHKGEIQTKPKDQVQPPIIKQSKSFRAVHNGQQSKRTTEPSHCDAEGGEKESERKLSRWLRFMGRFKGENRVREETLQAKDLENTEFPHLRQSKPSKPLKKAVEDTHPDHRKRGRLEPPEPRKSSTKKWISCEDLSRIPRRNELPSSRTHFELVKPVLEPVRFTTLELAHDKEVDRNENAATQTLEKDSEEAKMTSRGDSLHPTSRDESLRLQKTLLFLPERLDPSNLARKARVIRECKSVVERLCCKKGKEQGVVAAEARLLAKDHPSARVTLATLGAIPPLISMLESSSTFCAHSALLALYNLAIGNDANKAAIVDLGCVPKLLTLLQNSNPSMQETVVATFLSLSALDRNKPLIGTSGAIPLLVHTLKSGGDFIRRDALRALYNLSLAQCNVKALIETGMARAIMDLLQIPLHGEKTLAILSNMVGVAAGRKEFMDITDGLEALIAALGWSPKCQERAAYVLMVVAHHSYGHRQAMAQKRAIPALLEVSLLGSALAQKRAVRVLECLREDREQGRPMSAPLGKIPLRKDSKISVTNPDYGEGAVAGSKVVNHMVQESLQQNLERIVRRANIPAMGFVKGEGMRALSLTGCSSSKSLPF